MAACAPFAPLGPYVGNVLAWTDCQTLALGEAGYRALGPGSAFGMALTGLLTIYVALIGYRLLLGGDITVREGLATALRLGVVLALATQWPAYRTLIFDVVTKTPEAVTSDALGASGLAGGGSGTLAVRLDGVNAALAQLIEEAAASKPAPPPQAGQAIAPPAAASAPSRAVKAVLAEPAAKSIDSAIGLMVASALGGLLAVRVIMGVLLALGPVFIAALLFEATRGLFVGWLRVLAGALVGAIGAPVVIALQLAIVEPQVLAMRDLLDTNQSVGALPQQILGTAAVFGLVMVALLVAMARVGLGFAWASKRVLDLTKFALPERPLALPPPDWARAGAYAADGERSRAQRIGDAVQVLGARDQRLAAVFASPQRLALPHAAGGALDGSGEMALARVPLGQSGRRSAQRQGQAARRRDEIA